jgi:hypothetical protein
VVLLGELAQLCVTVCAQKSKVLGWQVFPSTTIIHHLPSHSTMAAPAAAAGWNVMDAAVVLLGWIDLLGDMSDYTAIRAVRVLRPLRTIAKVDGMRVGGRRGAAPAPRG